jgi:PAS domain S-box-containing protein
MSWRYAPYVWPLLVAAAALAALAFFAWRRRPAPGARAFTLLMLAASEWALGYALELGSTALPAKVFWADVQYLGIVIVPGAWLVFVFRYVEAEEWLSRRNLALLAIEPAVMLALVWTNATHGLVRSSVRLDSSGPFPVLDYAYGAAFWINAAYSYALLLVGTLLLLQVLFQPPRLYRMQAIALLIGALAPWAGNALYISGLRAFSHLDPSPFAFILTGLAVVGGLFRFRLLDLVPIARSAVIERMDEGVMVLDAQSRVVDLNAAAARVAGHPVPEIIGRSAAEVLSAWPGLIERYRDVMETHTEITLEVGDAQHAYDLRISPLYDRDDRLAGRLFVSLDVTGRKRAEEALRESEGRFHSIFDNAAVGVALVDNNGYVLDANEADCHFLGYSHEEMVGMHFAEFTYPKDLDVDVDLYDSLLQGKRKSYMIDKRYVRKDGEIVWGRLNVSVVRDIDRRPQYTVVVCEDITERKLAEEALRESAERFRQMAENSRDVFWMRDLETLDLIYITPAYARLWGQSIEDAHEQPTSWLANVHPEDRDRIAAAFEKQIQGEFTENEYRIVWPDGSIHWIRDRVFPIRDEAGEAYRTFGVVEDITERKLAEEALRESEEKQRAQYKGIPIPTYTWQRKGDDFVLADYNDAAMAITQGKIGDYVGIRATEMYNDAPGVLEKLSECYTRKTSLEHETFYRFKTTGESKHLAVRYGFVPPDLVLAHAEDITERKRTEAEREQLLIQVREQARQVQQIVDTVPEGVILLDADEHIVLANPLGEKNLVTVADARIGDTLTHLGDRPLAELLTSPPKGLWHEVATGGRSFQVIAGPIESGPTPGGWVLVIRDVTQQRQVEQHIQQQERLAAVGQLAAGIAHDFNNIMATIVLYAQTTARAGGLPDAVRERMRIIDQQAYHATRLIQQILDFSRRAVLERRPLDLLPLVKEQIKLLERTLPENIEIKLDYEPDEYATLFIVEADPTRMQQMMTNLAVNARDAMPEGGTLRFTLERVRIEEGEAAPLPEMGAGEWVQMTVLDTGRGIPPDVLPHIFEPFFTTKGRGRGSGLGLAQVHGIVAQHEGRIDVETEPGRGTTFTIYLPARLPEPSTAVPLRKLPATAMGQGETVLVVEDDASVRQALVESLELLNYRTLEAANGQEALAIAEELGDEIGLVLSDVVMPGMDGVALLRGLRERGSAVPVVMLTGHPPEEKMKDLRAQGLLEWLPKPPELEQLAEMVARALSKD